MNSGSAQMMTPTQQHTPTHPSARARVYRSTSLSQAPGGSSSTWATREIAALDFLLGIPLENERSIVRAGLNGRRDEIEIQERRQYQQQQDSGVAAAARGLSEQQQEDRTTPPSPSLVTSEKNAKKTEGDPVVVPNSAPSWWEKLISKDKGFFFAEDQKARRRARLELEEKELEKPTNIAASPPENNAHATAAAADTTNKPSSPPSELQAKDLNFPVVVAAATSTTHAQRVVAPGRRLDGRDASTITIPKYKLESKTRQRIVARQAAVREWEFQVAHGIVGANNNINKTDNTSIPNINNNNNSSRGLLDGRAFFSQKGSYPVSVFSVIKYEPKKEEAERKRKIVERLGRGGTDFVMPERDWRGISYRALLPRIEKKNRAFNRLVFTKKKFKTASTTPPTTNNNNNKLPPAELDISLKNNNNGEAAAAAAFKNNISSRRSSQNTTYSETTAATKLSDEANNNPATVPSSTTNYDGSTSTDDEEEEEEDDDDNETTISTSSSEESDYSYVPGFLDDPEMLQGRHRHVMVGDKVTGCVVLSVIQFVQPAELKADLNKQFRERFDGWEPPKSQRKFIGAKVIDGVYTLMDPTEATSSQEDIDVIDSEEEDNARHHHHHHHHHRRKRSISVEMIRMPPSLTLSKIRSVKQQALMACVQAKLEISTVALACVYFERLCLDCRVDKVNRRLSFAACLLLAAKINEANIAIVHGHGKETKRGVKQIKSWIKPTNKSSNIFASLLEFFTHDWSCSLKHLFDAEWGVFAALGFRLHATPSQVAFHFKRLMKALEWAPLSYLGHEMYNQWQESLIEEVRRRERHEERKEFRRNRQEQKLMKLQRELHIQQTEEVSKRSYSSTEVSDEQKRWDSEDYTSNTQQSTEAKLHHQNIESTQDTSQPNADTYKGSPLKSEQTSTSKLGSITLLNRLGIKKIHRTLSSDKNLNEIQNSSGASEEFQRSVSFSHVHETNDIIIDVNEEAMTGVEGPSHENLSADDLDSQTNSDCKEGALLF